MKTANLQSAFDDRRAPDSVFEFAGPNANIMRWIGRFQEQSGSNRYRARWVSCTETPCAVYGSGCEELIKSEPVWASLDLHKLCNSSRTRGRIAPHEPTGTLTNMPDDWVATTSRPTIDARIGDSVRTVLGRRLIERMSPDARAIYEQIRALREEIGVTGFDVVEALRELRDDE